MVTVGAYVLLSIIMFESRRYRRKPVLLMYSENADGCSLHAIYTAPVVMLCCCTAVPGLWSIL